jgi:hypothetical protein
LLKREYSNNRKDQGWKTLFIKVGKNLVINETERTLSKNKRKWGWEFSVVEQPVLSMPKALGSSLAPN